MPVLLDGNIQIGATGAVSALKGPYIKSVTRLGAGAYQIKLSDNYNKFYGIDVNFSAAVTGSNILLSTGLTAGQAYVITAMGNSSAANFHTAGVPAEVTPAVGVGFVAITSAAGTGSGAVKAIAPSGIAAVEVVGDPNLSLAPSPSINQGAVITIQCYAATSSSVTSLIPADPANGSKMFFDIYLSNSSVLVNGE